MQYGNIYYCILVGTERPTMKDINIHVVNYWAPRWKDLALELNVDSCTINIIEKDYRNDCKGGCQVMLDKWLRKTPTASWKDLISASDNLLLKSKYTRTLFYNPTTECVTI